MSSFVTEVLASSGKLEKDDLACKISKLSRKVEETKEEVTDMINKKYIEFIPSMEGAEELLDQVQQNLHDAVTEYAKLKQQLEKNTAVIDLLQHLQEFDTAKEEYHRALQEKNYVVAAKQHGKARASVDALKAWKDTELPLIRALSSEITIQRENLIYHLGEEWKELAVWKLPSTKTELTSVKSFLKTALHLNRGGSKGDESVPHALLPSILQALSIQGELHKKIKLFGQVLFKYMLKPLIIYPSLVVEVSSQPEQGAVLSLQCTETKEEHPDPSQVYTKVLTVLKTLHEHLFDVCIDEKKVSEILGDLIWEEMSECIIRECLVHSIPANSSQLSEYSEVIKQTEDFESSLKEMGYLAGDSTDLLKYARNVNCHFASKKCQDVIVAARKLMTSEMHNTVKITPEYKLSIPKLPSPSGEKEKKESSKKSAHYDQQSLENEKQLSPSTLCLPECRISESVQQLMDLAVQTLSEAVGSSPQCAVQLFYTVRNIFHLFYDVVPTYHKDNFLKLPHLAAIQHNNCMFIAHHLLTLGFQFKPHLPLKDGVAYFVDLVIHQLRRLGKVWQDVLPVNIYCKAIGTLLNTAISELINKIMMLEDISNVDGERLRTLCQTIIEEGPLVFNPLPDENKNKKYQEEVPVYVKKWMTLKEISMVLNANLQEIVDRWAEGKGPLAVEFSCNEMKSLIRALFKNTERRAAALAKIVK
ncbi:centromere kinetochore zw10-like protein [Labeo rohita]|uniref:Centromere/kinetochore protein zw10 homolog n=1 Tax=Labeo rohita TaxID=84645 RepID=A0A498N5G7_LABRO|nr:centromere kinetochore zw10-like protein [Labeo rohita]